MLINIMGGNPANWLIGQIRCIIDRCILLCRTPVGTFRTFCDVNLEQYPYDTQSCHLYFGSWTHTQDQINITTLGWHLWHQLLVTFHSYLIPMSHIQEKTFWKANLGTPTQSGASWKLSLHGEIRYLIVYPLEQR